MASTSRDQALSLLAAANNHGDLAVKLSSLRQAKDILLSVDSSLASDLFPYLAELQFSPQGLVRKSLLEIVEEVGLRAMEYSSVLMPMLLAFLRDDDPVVAAQSIVCGTKFFSSVLEEMAMQMHRRGKVERWLEDLWMWMVKFKDVVLAIALEPGLISTRLLALKFLETFVLLFSPDNDDYGKPVTEGSRHIFNVSWLAGGSPFIDPVVYIAEAKRTLGTLFDLLQSANSLPGSMIITTVTCLAAIARKRPQHFNIIFSTLLDFNPNCERVKGFHALSVQYSLRSAFLGFLRCTYPPILESRERLVRALRAMNAGDAAEQVIRQVDKFVRNAERASRDARLKNDQPPNHMLFAGDLFKKRPITQDDEDLFPNQEMPSKRSRYGSDPNSVLPVQTTESGNGSVSIDDASSNVPVLVSELTPAEQMIAMIGALLAEGERGAESLEILISKMHPDMLADIVITNMKHLPKIPPPLTRVGNSQVATQVGSGSSLSQVTALSGPAHTMQPPVSFPPVPHPSVLSSNPLLPDSSNASNFLIESKRDPRRDPRRQDPRLVVPPEVLAAPIQETADLQSDLDSSNLSKPLPQMVAVSGKSPSAPSVIKTKNEEDVVEYPSNAGLNQQILEVEASEDFKDDIPAAVEVKVSSDFTLSPKQIDEEDNENAAEEVIEVDESESPLMLEADQQSPTSSNTSALEESTLDLPSVPSYVDLTAEQECNLRKLSVKRIIESYKHLTAIEYSDMRMLLIARLAAQIDGDHDLVGVLQKHILEDYQLQKGHELVLHILYHLHILVETDAGGSSGDAALTYEKYLLAVAKSLLEHFPASDKSFSRLLGEAPMLPESLLKLLDDLCYSDVLDQRGKPLRDADRVTQGLGSVWSLILGRPLYRESCLDMALKCAVHSQDEIRAKAIRLVANKLYQLSYISENIEQFAINMLLSAVNQKVSDGEVSQHGLQEQSEGEGASDKTSMSGSEVTTSLTSDTESVSAQALGQSSSSMSFPEAQRLTSLYFALCTKKPNLLCLVFDTYGRAPKTVKQAIHRHIPVLIRALGTSYSELLHVISDPPQGSENLLTLVLQILTDETVPSPDLIATVKHLYETKLKDVSILIPMLSSFTKTEVLPIFPRLLDLPPERFQKALAHILQGSAHTGPALTPAEVLVAIHDIVPEKDGLPLKKVMDACSACFEQRTVFTQQVLAKALNQMVDQTPLPLLFMRTVIQAIDAFPGLVDFVMEILSKLVNRQVWKMPKLWVGFLKCVSQTQPHSYRVLLQLPPPQLESSLNKYATLRAPLAAFAGQPNIRTTLPRSTLTVLGLATEPSAQQPHHSSSLHSVT